MKKIFFLFLLCTFIGSCSEGSKYKPIEFDNTYKFSEEILKEAKEGKRFGEHQYAAWEFAFQGDYKNALSQWDLARQPDFQEFSQQEIDSLHKNYKVVDAKKYLVKKIKSHQIVIINEAHHNSFHRHFTSSLLEVFYQNDFRYLGLETLENGLKKDPHLNTRNYPIQASGFYTRDPTFGSMLRKALKMGYNVFPYEDTTGVNHDEREIEQAKNIKKIIDQNPDAKFLIHCGFGHVMEGVFPSGMKALAERLKEYTGIDPLTIDQVAHSEKSNPNFYSPLSRTYKVRTPSVLVNENGEAVKNRINDRWTDIAIVQPKTSYDKGRPGWLFEGKAKPVAPAIADIDLSFPLMVLAFKKEEDYQRAIPVDIIEVKNRQEEMYLALDPGEYIIVLANTEEKQENMK
ncbi:hypothetical protein APR41_14955 [Salegentibacter salinarum]|uniref:Uncharacterized protein n=1 Tax=Salegentibacter salinarum TaxID=447422 RepID=A0A2N0TZ04_9FLAO|nr:hypothetical protein [Salegentibacter salinarum]PKD19977.1 hypothetical protein APR41_14955 [Salegentibacter salinarum]SKB96882.1 hypothetical protein SAMN05660903_03538 [Salegentibacter salinarum]